MTRKILLAMIVAVGLAAIGVLLVGRQRYSHLELKSCFNDVQGLKAGASVRIAGVDVGTVRRVRANPEMRNCPAEVDMELLPRMKSEFQKTRLRESRPPDCLGKPTSTSTLRRLWAGQLKTMAI
jgi:hypothetical protein